MCSWHSSDHCLHTVCFQFVCLPCLQECPIGSIPASLLTFTTVGLKCSLLQEWMKFRLSHFPSQCLYERPSLFVPLCALLSHFSMTKAPFLLSHLVYISPWRQVSMLPDFFDVSFPSLQLWSLFFQAGWFMAYFGWFASYLVMYVLQCKFLVLQFHYRLPPKHWSFYSLLLFLLLFLVSTLFISSLTLIICFLLCVFDFICSSF